MLFGVPLLYGVLGLLHPTVNPEVGDETGLFLGLHVAQLFLIGGLSWMLWLLVEGLNSRAATVTRALLLPFIIAYTALDAVLGIAWSVVAAKANELPAADQPAAGKLLDELLDTDPLGLILYWGAGMLWLAVALAAVTALRRQAPPVALALVAIGSVVFVLGHARPMGPIAMALILTGIVWLELRPGQPTAEPVTAVEGG